MWTVWWLEDKQLPWRRYRTRLDEATAEALAGNLRYHGLLAKAMCEAILR